MTLHAPPPPPDLHGMSDRALDIAQWSAKWAIALGAVYAFVEKVGKPYHTWRKQRLVADIREALSSELQKLGAVEELHEQVRLVLERQAEMYEEVDLFLALAHDNHERHNETNDLLNEVFHLDTDRRIDPERRRQVAEILVTLQERITARRRHTVTATAAIEGRS